MGMDLRGMPRLYPGARGVLDPLFFRACYLECEKNKFLMLVCDTVGTDAFESHHQDVIRNLSRKLSIPLQNIWLTATHCHSSAGTPPGSPPFLSKVWNRYIRDCMDKLAQVAAEAVKRKEQVEFGYARADVEGVGGSRRVKLSDGTVVTGWGDGPSAPPGLKTVGRGGHDPELGVIVFRNMKGRPVGTILNYNSHIHMYPILNFSSELAGYTCRLLEKKIKGVTAIYTNGALGDVALCVNIPPLSPRPEDWDRQYRKEMTRMSGILVKSALHSLRGMSFESKIKMGTAAKSFPIGSDHKKDQKELVAGMALNDLALLAQGHEIFSEFALRLKRESPFKASFVIGLNGDCDFYIPTAPAWEEGGYEASRYLAQGNFEVVTREALQLLNQLYGEMR